MMALGTGGAWQCHKCTFENEPSMVYCEVCECPKSDENKNNSSAVNGTIQEWKCDICTHENKMATNICRNCGAGRPAKFNVSPVNSIGPKAVKRPLGGWECTECFQVNNEWQTFCCGCYKSKEDKSKKFKIDEELPVWVCSKCTFKNTEKNNVCGCCYQTRNQPTSSAQIPVTNPSITSTFIPSSIKTEQEKNINNSRNESKSLGAWSCPNCTLENPVSSKKCEVCHANKPTNISGNNSPASVILIDDEYTEIQNNIDNEKKIQEIDRMNQVQESSSTGSQPSRQQTQDELSRTNHTKEADLKNNHDTTLIKSYIGTEVERRSPEIKINETKKQHIIKEETPGSSQKRKKNENDDDITTTESYLSAEMKRCSPEITEMIDTPVKENKETETHPVDIQTTESPIVPGHQDIYKSIDQEKNGSPHTKVESEKNTDLSFMDDVEPSTSFSSPQHELDTQNYRKYKELRMVLVGRTGAGKSLLANNILNGKYFKSKAGACSVTKTCCMEKAVRYGKKITIVDTPGLFDTDMSEQAVKKEIAKCVGLSAPGPHAIVLVIRADRFTEEELQTIIKVKDMFGEMALKHMIIMFTRKDDLDRDNSTIEDMIDESGGALKELVNACSGRYLAVDNRARPGSMGNQIRHIISEIERLIAFNNGMYYTNDMYEVAECFIQQREEEIKKALEAEKAKQLEILEMKFKVKMEEREREHSLIISQMKGRISELESVQISNTEDVQVNDDDDDDDDDGETNRVSDSDINLHSSSESSEKEDEVPKEDIQKSPHKDLSKVIFRTRFNKRPSESSYTTVSDGEQPSNSEKAELEQQVDKMEESHHTEVEEMQEQFDSERQRTNDQFDDIDIREQVQRDVEVEEEETVNNLTNRVWDFGKSVYRGAQSLFWR